MVMLRKEITGMIHTKAATISHKKWRLSPKGQAFLAKNKKRKLEYQKLFRAKKIAENPNYHQAVNSKRTKEYNRNAWLKTAYGIDNTTFNKMLVKQKHKCKICKQKMTKQLHVDHCHKTYKIRGLLCRDCNTGIGLLKENTTIIKNAIKYIKEHNE